MHCNKYKSLTKEERDLLTAKLLHAISADDTFFIMAQRMVHRATEGGLYDNVKFGEEVYQESESYAER